MFDFYVSDIGTDAIKDCKYYWQNEKSRCCILVPDYTRDRSRNVIPVHFMQLMPEVTAFCNDVRNPDIAKIVTDAGVGDIILKTVEYDRVEGVCQRKGDEGRILNAVLDLIDANSWSFPRARASKPYITKVQAQLMEDEFKCMVQAPADTNTIFVSVSKAGTMLAKRLGIEPAFECYVSHYDMETNTQDDSLIKVQRCPEYDISGKAVIVIEDLISSGRTANAVISELLNAGAARIYFFALYRTICSKEVELNSDSRVLIRSAYPLSNAYWTYGRGFDLTDEHSRLLPDIYASTKHWDWEHPNDVDELISYFGGCPLSRYR